MAHIIIADEVRYLFTAGHMAAEIAANDPFQDHGTPCWQCPGCAEEHDTGRRLGVGSHSPTCERGDW